MIDIEQIKLFRSLFNGREDAFAIRWERQIKAVTIIEFTKAKGGTLANYPDKTLQPLTDEQVKPHLFGEQLTGSN